MIKKFLHLFIHIWGSWSDPKVGQIRRTIANVALPWEDATVQTRQCTVCNKFDWRSVND